MDGGIKSLAALVYIMLIWIVDLILDTIVHGSKGSKVSDHTQESADQLDLIHHIPCCAKSRFISTVHPL